VEQGWIGALIYAELGTHFPNKKSGCDYIFPSRERLPSFYRLSLCMDFIDRWLFSTDRHRAMA